MFDSRTKSRPKQNKQGMSSYLEKFIGDLNHSHNCKECHKLFQQWINQVRKHGDYK